MLVLKLYAFGGRRTILWKLFLFASNIVLLCLICGGSSAAIFLACAVLVYIFGLNERVGVDKRCFVVIFFSDGGAALDHGRTGRVFVLTDYLAGDVRDQALLRRLQLFLIVEDFGDYLAV